MGQGTEPSAKVWFPVTTWVWRRLSSRRACRLYLWGLAIVVVALAILYLLITPPRRNLDRFLQEVATVQIGKTKLEDWRAQVERDHISNVSLWCNHGVSGVEWQGENKLLHKLRLAPRTNVSASVGFKDGTASEVSIILEIVSPNKDTLAAPPPVMVEQSIDRQCVPHYIIRRGVGVISVGMGACVSPQYRARALAINTSCLTRIGGCKTLESILPQVFGHP